MSNFKIALVNVPSLVSDELTPLLRREQLGTYSFVNAEHLPSFFKTTIKEFQLNVIYAADMSEGDISVLTPNSAMPIIMIVKQSDFEMERTAKSVGIDLIIEESEPDISNLVYGFIKQFFLYQNHKALVIDDSNVDNLVTCHILENEFVKARGLKNPTEAIQVIAEDKNITIILLDFEMPQINGCQLMDSIRDNFKTREFIFIGLTGSRNGIIQFLNNGANEVLSKPLDNELLTVRLRREIFRSHQDQQDNKALSNYISIFQRFTHDARNPLHVINTVAEKAINSDLSHDKKEYLNALYNKAKDNLSAIFDEVVTFLELKSHKESYELKACSLNSMISTQLFLESYQAEKKNIIINKDVDAEISAMCEKNKIQSVISNLTNNAVKYSSLGSTVDVRLYKKNNDIIFEVEDTAPQIPTAEVQTIFKPYARAKNITPTGGEGSTGLGLHICKEIINNHGGEIGCRHGQRGNIFYFVLPNQNVPGDKSDLSVH